MTKRTIIIGLAIMFFAMTGRVTADDLAARRKEYRKSLDEILQAATTQKEELNKKYADSLDGVLTKTRDAGDKDKVAVVEGELKRFKKEKAKPMKLSEFADVKILQGQYINEIKELEIDKAKKIIELTEKYDKTLEAMQKNLVLIENAKEADSVQAERKKAAGNEVVVAAYSLVRDTVGLPEESGSARISATIHDAEFQLCEIAVAPNIPVTVEELGPKVARTSGEKAGEIAGVTRRLQGAQFIRVPAGETTTYGITVEKDGYLYALCDSNDLAKTSRFKWESPGMEVIGEGMPHQNRAKVKSGQSFRCGGTECSLIAKKITLKQRSE